MGDSDEMSNTNRLKAIHQELRTIRQLVSQATFAMHEAESEVPEKMRRFITYMHDLHDVCYMYEVRGLAIPKHVLMEMERCDDRYRQLLEKEHTEGTFERVRREMAKDPKNRWDHTRLLSKPKETP